MPSPLLGQLLSNILGAKSSNYVNLYQGAAFVPTSLSGLAAWYSADSLTTAPIDPANLSGVVARYRADQFTTGGVAPSAISGCVANYRADQFTSGTAPSAISGCVANWRADTGITQAGGKVSAWNNIITGDSTTNLSQNTGAAQGTYNASDANLNNQPSITFGAGLFMATPTLTTPIPFGSTIIAVGYLTSNVTCVLIDGLDTTHRQYMYYTTTLNTGTSGVADISSSVTDITKATFMCGTFAATGNIYSNSNVSTASGSLTTHSTMTGITMGNDYQQNLGWKGAIAEVAVFNRVLTDAEIKSVAYYAANRYGVALKIGAWNDTVSGDNTHNLAQSSYAAMPALTVVDSSYSNQPSLSFASASSQSMSSATWTSSIASPFTIVVIGNDSGANTFQCFTDTETGAAEAGTVYNDGIGTYAIYNGSTYDTGIPVSNTPKVIAAVFNGASSHSFANTNTPQANGNAASSAFTGLTVGKQSNAAIGFLNGKIVEVAVFNKALSTAEVNQIQYYATSRYGLAIKIGAWNDTSGQNDATHNASQQTYSKMPTLTASDSSYGNQPSLSFVAASLQWLTSSAWTSSIATPFSIVVIGNDDGTASIQQYSDSEFGAPETGIIYNNLGAYKWYSGTIQTSGVTADNTPKIFAANFGASGNIYVNGNAVAASGDTGARALTGLTLGNSSSGNNELNGKIVEAFVVNRALTQAEVNGLQIYAANRYGLSLRIGSWTDQSGANNNANTSQTTYSAQPVINITDTSYNKQPTLSFASASSQTLASASFTSGLAHFTIFVAGNYDGTTNSQMFVGSSTPIEVGGGNNGGSGPYIYGGAFIQSNLGNSANPLVQVGVFNAASSALYVSAKTAVATGNIGNNSLPIISLGSVTSSQYLNGKIAEVIVYNRGLSQAEISQLLTYLGQKYSITIGG